MLLNDGGDILHPVHTGAKVRTTVLAIVHIASQADRSSAVDKSGQFPELEFLTIPKIFLCDRKLTRR